MTKQDSGFSSSEVMYPAVVGNGEMSGSMVPAQPYASPVAPPFGSFAPRGPEIIHGGFNQTWFFNCLRRKWLSALLLGGLAAALIAGVLLWLFPESSSVTAYLSVKALEHETLFDTNQRINPREYEIFQSTQIATLKSQFVLNAALNRSDISQLDAVDKEGPDALAWLSNELKVSFPGDGEILEVRFDGEEDPAEIMKLVDAVIDAYIFEVSYKERARSSETRESLRKLHRQLVVELGEKMDKFQKLSKELDSSNSASTSAMLSMLISDVRMIQQQVLTKKQALLEIEVMKTLAVQQANSTAALEAAIQEEMARDPMIQNFQEEQFAVSQQMAQLRAITKRKNPPEVKQLQQHLDTLKQQIQEHRITKEAEVRSRLKSVPNDALAQVMSEYMTRRRSAESDLVELQEQLAEKMDEVQLKGQVSGPLTILASEIAQLQEVERTMDLKLRSWDVEQLLREREERQPQRSAKVRTKAPEKPQQRRPSDTYSIEADQRLLEKEIAAIEEALLQIKLRPERSSADEEARERLKTLRRTAIENMVELLRREEKRQEERAKDEQGGGGFF